MSVEETEETLTDPDNRIIKQITVDDIKSAEKLFEDLMGAGINPRKNYIKAHSEEAIGNV
jgi:DNA gyrase subunit B